MDVIDYSFDIRTSINDMQGSKNTQQMLMSFTHIKIAQLEDINLGMVLHVKTSKYSIVFHASLPLSLNIFKLIEI